jgi:hypothetical protein
VSRRGPPGFQRWNNASDWPLRRDQPEQLADRADEEEEQEKEEKIVRYALAPSNTHKYICICLFVYICMYTL